MASTQHPGSPGWPQQRLRRQTLIIMFRNTCHNRTCKGPGAIWMIRTDLCIDLSIPAIMRGSISTVCGGTSRNNRSLP